MIALDWATLKHHMVLAFENGDLGEDLGDVHLGLAVDHHAQRPFLSMLTEQHHRLAEVWLPKAGGCNKKNSFSKRCVHVPKLSSPVAETNSASFFGLRKRV